MSGFEVANPILNSPFDEPVEHWWILEGEPAERRQGRRPAMYYYLEPGRDQNERRGIFIELKRVNLIRERLKAWREEGWPGVTRTTLELFHYWRREGRRQPLFFAQLEAVETVIFLAEARDDFRQGIEIPRDEPSPEEQQDGYTGFVRQACKMATGAGKTTVMAMLAAWSLLNKAANRGDRRFADTVLVVCPNVTIRERLRELDPDLGDTSLYRSRDLVPAGQMDRLRQGVVIITNWHVLAPQQPISAGDGGRVVKAGVPVVTTEVVRIGKADETRRGSRHLTRATLLRQIGDGLLEVVEGDPDTDDQVKVRSTRYVESEAALLRRVLRRARGKKNLLVFNDEAHHAYRIRVERPEDWEELDETEREDWLADKDEATVWMHGLDTIHKQRGIGLCVDLSATPYFLSRVGQQANRPFPWVVSDFGLIDAIESGLVKIPQLAVRDNTGAEVPGYYNIWDWILKPGRLTNSERGGKRSSPKPEAILKWSHHPIAMLGGLWEETWAEWRESGLDSRPPVFILVCRNTALANVIYEWLANGTGPVGIPQSKLDAFRNTTTETNTIVVHSKVVEETDSGAARSDEMRWMRFTLDTVGKKGWPRDAGGVEIHPVGFCELAEKLKRAKHPPGRDVRCIVSVGMLTEGWDCNTVTHILGLRPFQSQLLCEQVVGRGLRRRSYEVDAEGHLTEEVAKVFGVPFQIIPFKVNSGGPVAKAPEKKHVHSLPERDVLEIRFPRVEGYLQKLENRVTLDWGSVPSLSVSEQIPVEVEMKGLSYNESGRLSLHGPGRISLADLAAYRKERRLQELEFDMAAALTREFCRQSTCSISPKFLFPQLARIIARFLREKVKVHPPADPKDLFLSPYYGWLMETLLGNLRTDTAEDKVQLLPLLESHRGPGSTRDVDFWTSRDVREVRKSHVNFVVADTKVWEQSAAFAIDRHPAVEAFVKNAGLGLGIPYVYNGDSHEYLPDFVIRLNGKHQHHLLLETKGFDPLVEQKTAAAKKWCDAVNAHGEFGHWNYAIAMQPSEVRRILDTAGIQGK